MPKQHRWKIKRDIDSAIRHLLKAEDTVRELKGLYNDYDGYMQLFTRADMDLIALIAILKVLRDKI